jgi:alpha-glucosidase
MEPAFPFVRVNDFTPNKPDGVWTTVGKIDRWQADAANRRFTFFFGQRSLFIEILGELGFRLRFNPAPAASYTFETSVSVVSRDLGLAGLKVQANQPGPNLLELSTGSLRIEVNLAAFAVAVYRANQLLHQDQPGQGILYIPGAEVVAVMKTAPQGAFYVGGGEKAGAQLFKNNFTFTYFNFDNYMYTEGPSLGQPGPLNPTVPLYCSIPFLIEINPYPKGAVAGPAYAYGIFLDNSAQSYINVTTNDYSDMAGKYYLGALYNELDYYFMAGDWVGDVLNQYTTLTGRPTLPPRYVFGFHQGAYGYFDRYRLSAAANAYREAHIPCDGLHIDVDFQDNYRTFTHSEVKFPACAQYFDGLHGRGFKLSTNITPLITDNLLGESGRVDKYPQRDTLDKAGALLKNSRAGSDSQQNKTPYEAGVNYGSNFGSNPYKYPPLVINRNPTNPPFLPFIPLTAPGNYPDFGLAVNRQVWGEQYQHLIKDLHLDMVWQDMTCPAINPNLRTSQNRTFPGDLLMSQEATDAGGQVHVNLLPFAKVQNAYALNLLKATFEGLGKLSPDKRNFIIARGGYAGIQRYAALWTGDSVSSWDFLRINIPEVLNLGLSGVPISGCDIGGFAKGPVDGFNSTPPDTGLSGVPFVSAVVTGAITNYELLTRWMQLGSFLPWFRNHYDGYNKGFQEAFAYGEPVPTNCRRYVELRYRMLQVYYDAMYKCTQTGTPIARALFLNDPHDPAVYSHSDDQFFVGDDFLVAPILDPHATFNPPTPPIRSIYLPARSDWYSFKDNQSPLEGAVPGGTTIPDYFADLDRVPIYVRAGAVLPFCELEQWVGELPKNPLTFNCYPGPDRWTDASAYQLYQDDGISAGAGTPYRLSRIYQRTINQPGSVQREVRVARVQGDYKPPANFFFIGILGSTTKPTKVSRDGTALPDAGVSANLAASPLDCWYWNADLQIAFVKIFDLDPPHPQDTTVNATY